MQSIKKISKREAEVLQLIALEHTTQEIANKLFLSKQTIISHRKNLMKKLEERNIAGTDRESFQQGILSFKKLQMKTLKITLLFIALTTTYSLVGQKKMTSFNPVTNGFKFSNSFKVGAGDAGSIKADWGGLCGGMTFSAADYYYTKTPVPSQKHTPAQGTKLYKHLYNRQLNAIINASVDKVAENYINIFGSRNFEFWGWGVDERLKQLKTSIDKNRPIPILLFNGKNQDVAKNHWVLAIGYDLGGYTFKKQNDRNVERVRIFVYDPNQPEKICVLIPKKGGDWMMDYHIWDIKGNRLGRNLDSNNRRWRHYYVYNEFKSKQPPIIKSEKLDDTDKVYKLIVQLKTGGDDLRGGNDNLNILVKFKDGTSQLFKKVNNGTRWSDRSTNNVELRLSKSIKSNQITCIKLLATLGGGFGGDNWNLDKIVITAHKKNGATEQLQSAYGSPWKRFTGDDKEAWICTKETNSNIDLR